MESIAIIGIGCRFPGANNPQEFWQLLSNGVDAITEIPAQRWNIDDFYDNNPETPGKMNSRYGGFLSQVDGFDPNFFGISPREAVLMDPQQRLLLEVAWEALEDAGIVREQLAGSKTGVFVGISTNDYSRIHPEFDSYPQGYDLTGNCINIAAGRLSYLLNLRGPSLAVDTACSSSLVAIHLACQSIWNQESNVAIASGVNLILSPIGNVALSKLKALSPDGRCKTFDESANGYVRSEGAGSIILKPLAQALADNDSIYAVIRGSAINHDGRSKGLTVPYGLAQEALIREALQQAEVKPKEISYVELHGTGTPLGDPIEAMALGSVLEEGRDADNPCLVGAVKSNIGHLEAAAGIASLIKVVLALKYQQIPPSLHFNQPNPYIPFDQLPLRVQSSLIPWQGKYGNKAGVSSFGFSGTNAHVILEEFSPFNSSIQDTFKFPHLLPISAHTPAAVKTLALGYRELVERQQLTPEFVQNICYTASVRRTHQPVRDAVVVNSLQELSSCLQSLGNNDVSSLPKSSKRKPKIAFVFSGQGPQWWAMGRELLAQEPVFRAAIEECDALIQKYAQWSLLQEFALPESECRFGETEIAQPALFALQVGLANLWRSWGIEPKAVVGHSLGEVAAAHFAGVLSLEDAVYLICDRGRLMQQATGNGKMLAVDLPRSEVEGLLTNWVGKLEVAVVNSPTATVISGESQALEAFVRELQGQYPNVFYKELPVNYAFHSQQMAPFAQALVEKLSYLQPQAGNLTIFSTVTGDKQVGKDFDADYWGRNLRQTVCFAPAVAALIESGYTQFLEISPHPVLSGYIKACLQHGEVEGVVLPSLRRNHGERATLLKSLGMLYTLGATVNWQRLYPDGCKMVNLPLYPWQRESYWLKESKTQFTGQSASSLLKLLVAGKTEKVTQELSKNHQLTTEAKQFLPQLLQLLVEEKVEGESGITEDLSNARYQVEWQLNPLTIENKSCEKEHWLIFSDNQGVGTELATVISEGLTLVSTGETYQRLASGNYQINPHRVSDFQQLLQDISAPITKVVYLWGLDNSSYLEEFQDKQYASLLYLVQALAEIKSNKAKITPQLWIVTQQAQAVSTTVKEINVAQTPLWGMAQVIALEYPQIWGGLIDLEMQHISANSIVAEMTAKTGEDRVAFRDGKRYVARLMPVSTSLPAPLSFNNLNDEGSYLITGGLGALGLTLAEWLIERGARHLILISRRELVNYSQEKQQKIRDLENLGAKITVVAADVSNYQQMATVFESIKLNSPGLRGVIHAAGVLNDCTIDKINLETFAKVFKPKVSGAWNLHQLTQNLSLDFFVCFSSMSALLGSRGQIHYAAANHFLDGLVHHRRSLGYPALSINWGPWAEGGMATQGYEQGLKLMGIEPLQPASALEIFGGLLAGESAQTMVAAIDWRAFGKIVAAKGRVAFLEGLLNQESKNVTDTENFSQQLAEVSPSRRKGLLTNRLQQEVARVLGHGESYLPEIDQGFFDMGMDSLMSVELKYRLETLFNISLPSTLAFEYPTIADVVSYLIEEVFDWQLDSNDSDKTESNTTEVVENTIAQLEGLSAAETEALMEQELAELETLLS